MSRRPLAAATTALLLLTALGACSTSSGGTNAASSPSASVSCAPADLNVVKAGKLTVGTDKPAYPPYFQDDNPSNGKGFESATAYAVAQQLGFAKSDVKWVVVPFNSSYAPGAKTFDFDINQISITPARAKAVTFSTPYYNSPQAVVALKGTTAATATTITALKPLKFGVQVGTTSLQFVKDTVQPTTQPQVFNDTAAATAALKNKQIDAIVVDLPTASYITSVELANGTVTGQFPNSQGDSWGLLMQKGNTLASCVDTALAALTKNGTLKALQTKYLPYTSVPVITQ